MDFHARSCCSLFRPHCVQFTHLRPLLYEAGHAGFVDAFNTRAPQASGTDLSPEQQDDAELARYANAALAAQTDAAFLDSAESYYALMDEGFQSGSIVGDQETNDAELAYCRALSSSGIADIPASANDLPFLSFLPYAIAQRRPSFPSSPSFSRRYSCSAPQGPGPWRQSARAQIPAPYPNRVFDNWRGDRDAPRRPCAREYLRLALNGFGQIGYRSPSSITARSLPRPRETSSRPYFSRCSRVEP